MLEYQVSGAPGPAILYVAGIAWGFVLLSAFAGWGLLAGRILRDAFRDDLGQALARGIAMMAVAGGFLNLLHLASRATVLGLIVTGLIALAALAPPLAGRLRSPGAISPLLWFAGAVALLAYLNWVYFLWPSPGPAGAPGGYRLYPSDDPCYLAHPVRMLQTGWLGIDPFNVTQTGSAVGGESFLQAFVLAVLPINYIHLIDPGLAYLAMAVMLGSMVRRPRLAALLILLFASIPTLANNCSAIGLPVVLLTAIYRECQRGGLDRDHPLRASAALALPLAALLSLKTTLIPGGVAIVVLDRAFAALARRRVLRPIAAGAMTGGLTLLFLLPWMIASYASCGSPLYPFLGEGFRASSAFEMPHKQFARSWPSFLSDTLVLARSPAVVAGPAFGLLAAWTLRRDRARLSAWAALLAGSMAHLALLLVVFSMPDFVRYSYPFRAVLLVVSFAILLGYRRDAPGRRRPAITALARLGLAGLIAHGGYRNLQRSASWPAAARAAVDGRGRIPPEEAAAYRRLQDALPASATVLLSEGKPFLLDFRRHHIYALDRPGTISPPPGLPMAGTPEDVAAYLRSAGVDYLVADHRSIVPRAPNPSFRESNNWAYSLMLLQSRWLTILGRLNESYRVAYRDDYLLAIDLTRPSAVPGDAGAPSVRLSPRGAPRSPLPGRASGLSSPKGPAAGRDAGPIEMATAGRPRPGPDRCLRGPVDPDL